jgi:uncharacterized protein YfdQ (DUF2303 family)
MDHLENTTQDAVAILRAGVALALPRVVKPEAKQYVLVPDGMKVQDLDAYFPHPMDVPHKVTVTTPEAFVVAVKRFPSRTPVLFGDEAKGRVTAVMDFSTDAQPEWGRHTIGLALEPSREWTTWSQQSGKAMDQVTFARFLEDHLPDIAEPAGADILQMASSLEFKKSVQFASSVRLDNGQHQLSYVEDIQGNTTKGSLAVVDRFTLGLAPWRGLPLYRVEARLRYRMTEGKVAFWVDLLRPHKVVEAAWADVCASITQALDGTFNAPILPGMVA